MRTYDRKLDDPELARLRDNLIFAAKAFRAYTHAEGYCSARVDGIVVAYADCAEDIKKLI